MIGFSIEIAKTGVGFCTCMQSSNVKAEVPLAGNTT